ncbi:MAG: hypothetical protein J2P25_14485 [Nocardiopsaceae bacterium]|nr:hypothetical protein [Nocardiopsaceae bacterium]
MGQRSDPIRTVSWCEAHHAMAEDVQRVQPPDGASRHRWGTHACAECRKHRRLTAAPKLGRVSSR